jgi:arylformamidase
MSLRYRADVPQRRPFDSDRDRIYVAGHSAGGHLTVMALLTEWEADYALPSDVIKGGCGISGLYDLAPLPYTCAVIVAADVGPSFAEQSDSTPSLRRRSAQPDKNHFNAIYGFTDVASPLCRAMLHHMQLT